MNDREELAREAEDRRLDAGLRELFGAERAPDVTTAVLARRRRGERVAVRREARGLGRGRLLLAAAVLLSGAATVLGTALLSKSGADPDGGQQAQQPNVPEQPSVVMDRRQIRSLRRDLRVVELRNLDDEAVRELASRCVMLEELRIHASTVVRRPEDGAAVSITDAALPAIASLKRLRRLELSGTVDVRGSGFRSLEQMPLLEELRIEYCDLARVALRRVDRIPSLRTLELYLVEGLTAEAVASIARVPGLRRLHVYGGSGLTAEQLAPLRRLERLESLQLAGLNHIYHGQQDQFAAYLDRKVERRAPDRYVTCDALQQWPQLRTLDVSHSRELGADVGRVLADRTPALRDLDLGHCPRVDDSTITDAMALPDLERLAIGGENAVTAASVDVLAASPSLREVDFGDTAWLTLDQARRLLEVGIRVQSTRVEPSTFAAELAELTRAFTRRTVRSVEEVRALNRLVTHVEVRGLGDAAAVLLAEHPSLESVRFDGDGGGQHALTATGVRAVLGLPRLETLWIHDVPGLPMHALRGVGDCRALRALSLRGCAVHAAVLGELARLPNLEALVIVSSPGTGSEHVTSIARCRKLQSLELRALPDLTRGWAQHLRALPSLRTLRLRELAGLDDAELAAIAQLTSVRELDLTGAPVAAEALRVLGNLEGLEQLCLADVDGATNDTLAWLPIGLQVLDLGSCDGFGAGAGTMLCDRLTNLVRLDLSHAGWLDAGGLADVLAAPSLVELSISSCPGVAPDDDLMAAIVAAPALRQIDADGTTCVTQEQFDRLRELRPELTIHREVR